MHCDLLCVCRSPRRSGISPACRHTHGPAASQTPADRHGPALPNTAHIQYVWAAASMLMCGFQTIIIGFRCKAVHQRQLTSANGKMWNIFIREHSLVTQQVSQTPQAWTTDDGHFRTLLRLGQQPVCCLLILVINVSESNGNNIDSQILLNHSSDSDKSVAYLYDNYRHNHHHHYHKGINTINTHQHQSHVSNYESSLSEESEQEYELNHS